MNTNEVYLIIGKNIRFYRLNNKYGALTQEELSRLSKVNISLIRGIESIYHNHPINLIALNNIARSLDIPLYKFFIKDC